MISPKKSLGQNFLKDKAICKNIVDALGIESGDTVIEIGPGTGALTDFLIENNIFLKLIEIDSRSINYLSEKYAKYNNYEIIEQSILDIDLKRFADTSKIKIIGNIPYYISGRILYKLFENNDIISSAVLTVQKEVAERVASPSGSKNYGILSVAAAYSGSARKLFDIPAIAFHPPPKVTSATLKLDFNPIIDKVVMEKVMKLVKLAFNQRRKMLSNSLKSYFSQINNPDDILKISSLWARMHNKRPEQITPSEFYELYKELNKNITP